MAPFDNTEFAIDGEAMVLDSVEVDVDIEKPVHATPNASANDALPNGPGCDFDGIDDFFQVPPNEAESIFERFPEIFTNDQDGRADDTRYTSEVEPSNTVSIHGQLENTLAVKPHQLPYSYMIETPGRVPDNLLDSERNWTVEAWAWAVCHPYYVARVPITDYQAYNIEGEKAMEAQFKRQIHDPTTYLLVVRGFKLLMTIRNLAIDGGAVIDARTFGIFLGRLFCGDCATIDIFNKYFLPENLEIVPDLAFGEIHKSFGNLYARFSLEPAARTNEMVYLLRILRNFDEEVRLGGRRRREHIGRLMVVKSYTDLEGNEVEAPPGGLEVPAGPELPRCLGVSPHFMAYYSEKWPFEIPPNQVDVCRLLERNPVARVEVPVTVCPRQTAMDA